VTAKKFHKKKKKTLRHCIRAILVLLAVYVSSAFFIPYIGRDSVPTPLTRAYYRLYYPIRWVLVHRPQETWSGTLAAIDFDRRLLQFKDSAQNSFVLHFFAADETNLRPIEPGGAIRLRVKFSPDPDSSVERVELVEVLPP